MAASVINIGAAVQGMGDVAGAMEKAVQGIRIVEKQAGHCHPAVEEALNDQGVALQLLGSPFDAVTKCEEELRLYARVYPGLNVTK